MQIGQACIKAIPHFPVELEKLAKKLMSKDTNTVFYL